MIDVQEDNKYSRGKKDEDFNVYSRTTFMRTTMTAMTTAMTTIMTVMTMMTTMTMITTKLRRKI